MLCREVLHLTLQLFLELDFSFLAAFALTELEVSDTFSSHLAFFVVELFDVLTSLVLDLKKLDRIYFSFHLHHQFRSLHQVLLGEGLTVFSREVLKLNLV